MIEYHEDGMICEVDVLDDQSDDNWYRYNLRIKRIFQHSRIFKSPPIGEEFSVTKRRNSGSCPGMWHLFGYQTDKK